MHANDSKDPCGSRRDRHENIGAGQIGERPFAALLRHPATAGVPFVVETPGPKAAHAADMATLAAPPRRRRQRVGADGYSWWEKRSSCHGSAELW